MRARFIALVLPLVLIPLLGTATDDLDAAAGDPGADRSKVSKAEFVYPGARAGLPIPKHGGADLRPTFESAGLGKVGPDLLFIYGEPGSNEGTFEDLAGQPDWQGWTSYDITQASFPDSHWHVHDTGAPVAPLQIDAQPGATAFAKSMAVAQHLAGDDRLTLVVGGNLQSSGAGTVSLYLGTDIAAGMPTWTLVQPNIHFGSSVADMGDIDGDGDHEILVGSPTSGDPATAHAYLGEPGTGLDGTGPDMYFDPFFADPRFGEVVAGIGDFNGDDYDDWAISGTNILYVYFGSATPDLSPDLFLQQADFNGWGHAIIGGDVTGDGVSDLLVGEPGAIVNGANNFFVGRVHVYQGSTTPDLVADHTIMGVQQDAGFGAAVAIVPPVNGGPAQDLVIGAPFYDANHGRVYVYDDAAPPSIYTQIPGPAFDGSFGASLAALPELAESGTTAFIVGEPASWGSNPTSRVWAHQVGAAPASSFWQGSIPFDHFGEIVANASGALGPEVHIAAASSPEGSTNGRIDILGRDTDRIAYCGDPSPPPEWVNGPGYGDNWNDVLDWYRDTPDPSQVMEVTLELTLRVEVEPGFDYVFIEYETAGQTVLLEEFTDSTGAISRDYSVTYGPGDYVTSLITGNPSVHLRIRVDTDPVFSDESGGFDSVFGAAWVDDITVTIDSAVVSSASFQPDGSDDSPLGRGFAGYEGGGWFKGDILFGDFSKVLADFDDIDPLRSNPTPQLAFVDDGSPPKNDTFGRSTGGSLGSTNYGFPGDWVVNYTGGVSGGTLVMYTEVWSPEIMWDDASITTDDDYDHAVLSFDSWLHLPFANGIFYDWYVRYYPDGGGSAWSDWDGDLFVFLSSGDPHYETRQHSIEQYVVPEAEKIQVSLVAWDLSQAYGVPGDDATPSPTFDNIRLFKQFNSTVSTITPVGVDVPVDLDDVHLDISQVTQEGVTEVVREVTFGDPANFYLATDPRIMYLITTTAEYNPPITVCITYDEADLQIPEQDMRLIHLEPGIGWTDITVSHDLDNDTICGETMGLSPFGLARVISPTDTAPERTPMLTRLHPPVPNPFNPRTVIRYELARAEDVTLEIYDVRGRLVRRLDGGPQTAGEHETVWNGKDDGGNAVASGLYLLRLKTPSTSLEQKMTLLR